MLCILVNVGASVYGRQINLKMQSSPLVITIIRMLFGSVLLLVTGLIAEGIGEIHFRQLLVVFWLAIVNIALAWILWNRSLQVLSAI